MVETNIVLSINSTYPAAVLYSLSFTSYSSRFEAISASKRHSDFRLLNEAQGRTLF